MKRVLIFSLSYDPRNFGGAEVAVREITERISPEEIEFHMVCLRFDSQLPRVERVGNILVHRIGSSKPDPSPADLKKFPLYFNKFFFQFSAAWHALSLHRQYRYDVIWAVMAHSCGVPAGIFKTMHPEVGYVLNLQEGDPIEYIEKKMIPLWPLFTRAFTTADIVQPLSTFLANWARARGFKGPIEIIPNAVDVQHFSRAYPREELAAARAKLGRKEGDVFLVTTSRLVKKNATDDVIRAMPLLPEYVHFVVYGSGPDETMLKALVEDLHLGLRVHFLGRLGHEEMPLMLRACTMFVRPSRSEGFGASFVEAMAAGLPVIATPVGGIPDFLFDPDKNPDKNPTGLFCDVNDPRSIARAIMRYIDDPALAARIADNARKMVIEKYDWNIIAADMKNKVFDVLMKRG
jgi:glycosyltransferase involved in cell wall biosynthesis